MDQTQKTSDNKTYELRRVARRPGHFQQERIGGHGDWRPLGSYALEVLRKIRRRDNSTITSWRITDSTSLQDAAALWHLALDQEAGLVPHDFQWRKAVPPPWWVSWDLPYASPGEFVQPITILGNEQVWVLNLSAIYSLVSGRLWRCRRCDEPFLRQSPGWPGQQLCAGCAKDQARRTARGLGGQLQKLWERIRNRHYQWVKRKNLSQAACGKRLRAALIELHLVQRGELPLVEWKKHWDYNLDALRATSGTRKPLVDYAHATPHTP
jgi:hypothetical protein